MSELVSIGREQQEVKLFDTKGGIVKLYKSLTAQNNIDLQNKYPSQDDSTKMTERAIDIIIHCFIDWNIGAEGVKKTCDAETLKQFSQRDLFAMLQACTGVQLLKEDGTMLSVAEIEKKGKGA